MKTSITVLLVCVLALGVIGCSSSSTSPSDSVGVQQLFPLKLGNQWVYESLDMSNGSTPDTTYLTLNVAGTVPVGGVNTFQLVASVDRAAVTDTSYLFYATNGIDAMSLSDVSNGLSRAQIFLRAPMAIGDSVVTDDTTYADGYRYRNVLYFRSKNSSITVPAGTFNCYYYEGLGYQQQSQSDPLVLSHQTEIYLAPGVGLVHDQEYSVDGGTRSSDGNLSLKSYTIK